MGTITSWVHKAEVPFSVSALFLEQRAVGGGL